MISRKLETNTKDDFRATCSGPKALAHKTWVSLSSHQFACPPHVTLSRDSVLCSSGDTCQVVCRVSGDPSPGIRWMVNRSLISDQVRTKVRGSVHKLKRTEAMQFFYSASLVKTPTTRQTYIVYLEYLFISDGGDCSDQQ